MSIIGMHVYITIEDTNPRPYAASYGHNEMSIFVEVMFLQLLWFDICAVHSNFFL